MKILLPFLLLMVMIGCKPKQQNAEQPDKDSASVLPQVPSGSEHIIQNIKDIYTQINNDSLIQKSFHWENDTTCAAPPMAGTVTFFYSSNAIVKILSVGAEDHGSWKEEYYFDNGGLIFIYQNNTYGGAANPDEFSYQNRYYLQKNILLKSIESNKDMHLNEADIKELAKTASKLLKAKNSSEMARIFSCE